MIEEDRGIRERLSPLRRVRVPPPPANPPSPVRRSGFPFARLAAAAMMLAALASALHFAPPAEEGSSTLARRMSTIESRRGDVRDEELRELIGRELELLRRELELARSGR